MPRDIASLAASNTSIARTGPPVAESGSTCRWMSIAPTSAGSVRPRSTGPRIGSTFHSSVPWLRLAPGRATSAVQMRPESSASPRSPDARGRRAMFDIAVLPSIVAPSRAALISNVDFPALALQLPQLEPLNLSRRRARQVRPHVDPARILPEACALLDVDLERFEKPVIGCIAVTQHDEGLGFHQTVRILFADDGGLQHRLVRGERGLDLERRHPHAAHLEHVVSAPAVVIVALRIAHVFVARVGPFTREGAAAPW